MLDINLPGIDWETHVILDIHYHDLTGHAL